MLDSQNTSFLRFMILQKIGTLPVFLSGIVPDIKFAEIF